VSTPVGRSASSAAAAIVLGHQTGFERQLDHDGVSGQQGGKHFHAHVGQRSVVRQDGHGHSVRLAHHGHGACKSRALLAHRHGLGHRKHVVVDGRRDDAVDGVAERGGGTAFRCPGKPDLLAVAQQCVGESAQYRDPFGDRHTWPGAGIEGVARSGDGFVDVGRSHVGHLRDHCLVAGVDDGNASVRCGCLPRTGDEVLVWVGDGEVEAW